MNGEPRTSTPRSALWAVLALLGIAYAVVVQRPGCAERSHLALIEALGRGTARIDARAIEYCDVSYWQGAFYSNKGPGLAFLALPFERTAAWLGLLPGDEARRVWLLGLWAVIVFTLALLWLVARTAERVAAGTGPLVAAALGAGTLVLPFATLFFTHVTAAALGFAGFVVLWGARRDPGGTARVAGAGLLAGLAGVVEYPMAFVAAALLVYAATGVRRLRGGLAFIAGSIAGILPLLVYNRWAFGSFSHLSYRAVVIEPGRTGHDVLGAHAKGFFAISLPDPTVLVSFLLEERGVLVLTPIVAAGLVGLILLLRTPHRAEALLGLGVCALVLGYNAGFDPPNGGPFGGSTPGPRFLIAALPFALFPLGLVFRRAAGAVVSLLAISVAAMAAATVTDPFIEKGQHIPWGFLLVHRDVQETVLSWAGAGRVPGAAVFLLCVAAAAVVGVASALGRGAVPLRELRGVIVAVVGWALVAFAARPAFEEGRVGISLLVAGAGVLLVVGLAPGRTRPGRA